MVYVTSDGSVVESRPWGPRRIIDIFWGAVDFISMFFRSLVGLDRPAVGSSGGGNGPSGGGPPKGPKKMGTFKTIQDCSMPGGG